MEKDQRIRDPIHNLIKFRKTDPDDELLWALLQTRPVQRLRSIRQLGFSDFVYPGATHTRFSHVVGAMQMARRLIEVLQRNSILDLNSSGYGINRRATLCAALLHDIGHGPYSHVFEEVSTKIGVHIDHEDFTISLISRPPISDLLERSSPGLTEKVLSFFKKDAGSNEFSRIVSSQFDADRLDFLLRDRYFTGVHFAQLDIEWLLDSIGVEKIPAEKNPDAYEFTFVIREKGISAVESYLSAYSQMYSKVYLHKTTRGVQLLFRDFLAEMYADPANLGCVPKSDPLRQYFEVAPKTDPKEDKVKKTIDPVVVDAFLRLDDSSVMGSLSWARQHGWPRVRALADRVFSRDLYRCFEPPKNPKEEPPTIPLREFRRKLKEAGLDPKIDVPPEKGYKQHSFNSKDFLENILVYGKSGAHPRPIAEIIPHVRDLADRAAIRFYFETVEDRDKAAALWKSI